MKHFLTACFCVLAIFSNDVIAQDQTASLSWTLPTENTDGTELTDLAGIEIHWGTESGSYTQMVTLNDPEVTSYEVTELQRGTEYFFAAKAFDEDDNTSDFSNEATKTTGGSTDSIPDSPTLTVDPDDLTAYSLILSSDNIALLPVGEVEEGTSCDETVSVNGRFAVPRDSVTWSGSVEPQVVVAECSGN